MLYPPPYHAVPSRVFQSRASPPSQSRTPSILLPDTNILQPGLQIPKLGLPWIPKIHRPRPPLRASCAGAGVGVGEGEGEGEGEGDGLQVKGAARNPAIETQARD
jgi:hypothetical protein